MQPPTPGQRRTMIYAPPRRMLADGCVVCNGSQTWCESIYPERCCCACDHLVATPSL